MKTVTITMDARQAAAVRQALFTDTKVYTYDPKSVPERVVDIRNVILDIDEQLEKEEVECQNDCHQELSLLMVNVLNLVDK